MEFRVQQTRRDRRPFHRPSGGPPPPQSEGGIPDFVARKVAAEIEAWLRHLGAERNLSGKTIEAYRRDPNEKWKQQQ